MFTGGVKLLRHLRSAEGGSTGDVDCQAVVCVRLVRHSDHRRRITVVRGQYAGGAHQLISVCRHRQQRLQVLVRQLPRRTTGVGRHHPHAGTTELAGACNRIPDLVLGRDCVAHILRNSLCIEQRPVSRPQWTL
eukprot:7379754-Prymnesium_polylepis.4